MRHRQIRGGFKLCSACAGRLTAGGSRTGLWSSVYLFEASWRVPEHHVSEHEIRILHFGGPMPSLETGAA